MKIIIHGGFFSESSTNQETKLAKQKALLRIVKQSYGYLQTHTALETVVVLPGTGYTPLYRFFLPSRGYHFYTASVQERDHIIANLRQYTYEGIGYYVLDSQWRVPDVAPITEAIHDVCLQAGTDTPLSCTNPATAQLYPQQDGHRLPPIDPANNPLIKLNSVGVVKDTILPECVYDESTGLMWENHTASAGIHSVKNRFTNLNNGAANDTSGHIGAVNAEQLCGDSDWRLPTLQELHTLMDYGVKSDVFGRTAVLIILASFDALDSRAAKSVGRGTLMSVPQPLWTSSGTTLCRWTPVPWPR